MLNDEQIWMHAPGDLTPVLVTSDEVGMLRATGWQPAEAPAAPYAPELPAAEAPDTTETSLQREETPAPARRRR